MSDTTVDINATPLTKSVDNLRLVALSSAGDIRRLEKGLVLGWMGAATDANKCTSLGIWELMSSAANIPSGTFRNILVCLPYSSSQTLTQVMFTHSESGAKVLRRYMVNGVWKDWKEFSLV